jgi:hypothetical protein
MRDVLHVLMLHGRMVHAGPTHLCQSVLKCCRCSAAELNPGPLIPMPHAMHVAPASFHGVGAAAAAAAGLGLEVDAAAGWAASCCCSCCCCGSCGSTGRSLVDASGSCLLCVYGTSHRMHVREWWAAEALAAHKSPCCDRSSKHNSARQRAAPAAAAAVEQRHIVEERRWQGKEEAFERHSGCLWKGDGAVLCSPTSLLAWSKMI